MDDLVIRGLNSVSEPTVFFFHYAENIYIEPYAYTLIQFQKSRLNEYRVYIILYY